MTDKPSILMIVIDALRADCTPFAVPSPHLRSLGLPPPRLPAFTRLVERSAVFTQAIACASYTSTCHASLFTGLAPPEHGVRAFSINALSREVRTLAEILVDAGYATCAMSDQPVFFQPQGLLRGFQLFVSAEDEALAWWDSYEGRPRFLFMHLWDAHQPYGMPFGRAYRGDYATISAQWMERLRSRRIPIPPAEGSYFEEAERHQVGLMQQLWQKERGFKVGLQEYIEGLATFDGGRLNDLVSALETRGILENAITVLTADHGEGRDIPPSPLCRHGNTLLDDQIRIPLYVRMPGMQARRSIAAQVSQADIAPTLLDSLGLLDERTAPHSTAGGRSLAPLLRGQALPDRPAYAEITADYRDPTALIGEPGTQRHPMIRYRTLRYPQRKYLLTGKEAAVSAGALVSPADDFLKTLFNDVLGRPPSDDEARQWLALIQATPATATARQALVERFQHSGESATLPKYAILDLAGDPLEQKPRDAQRQPGDWADFGRQLNVMIEIDREARQGEPLVSSETDEQIILKRLQGLGYVE